MAQRAKNSNTADAWKAKRRHQVTLPSGFEVSIEVPNLPMLVKTGQLPNELVAEALGTIQSGDLTPEIVARQAEFYNRLVSVAVKEPEISEEDVPELPFEDVELIVELATRQRDLDALGHHISGLHTNSDWRRFRGLPALDEDVESA